MAPLRGWAPRGRRLPAKVPHGRWKTMTFLAALRHDRIDAPWFIEGPIDGESFRTYVEKVLLPTLRPGDIVVMDNLGSHKSKIVRRLIRSAGAKLFFLPKYSPDLNPIEQVFAKLSRSRSPYRLSHGACIGRRIQRKRSRLVLEQGELKDCATRFICACPYSSPVRFDDRTAN
jgi:transposase